MQSEDQKREKAAQDLILTLDLLDFIYVESAETIQILKKSIKEIEVKLFFCITMLERLNNATEGLRMLFKEYVSNHRRFDFTIGIVLRSMLLDYIIMLNVFEILDRDSLSDKEKLIELDNFCLQMLSDSAIHALKYFKENSDTLYGEKRKRVLITLVENHPYCFEPYPNDGSEPILKFKKSFTQKELVMRLKKSDKHKHLSRKEDWYMFYSKYDHFGAMYLSVSAQHISKQFDNMCSAIREIPNSFVIILGFICALYPNNELLKLKLYKCVEYIKRIDDHN